MIIQYHTCAPNMQELYRSKTLARVSRKLKKNSLPKSFGFLRSLKVFEPSGIPLVLYYRLADHIRTLLIFLNSHSDSCISVQTELCCTSGGCKARATLPQRHTAKIYKVRFCVCCMKLSPMDVWPTVLVVQLSMHLQLMMKRISGFEKPVG